MALAHCFLSFLAVLNRARWPLTRPRLPFTPLALVFQCHLILVRPALFRDQVVVIEGRCLLSRVPGPACLAIVARLLREHNDLSVRNIAAISSQIVWLQGKGRSGIHFPSRFKDMAFIIAIWRCLEFSIFYRMAWSAVAGGSCCILLCFLD